MDILQEIQEEDRRDKFYRFLQIYGKYIIIITLALFILGILYFWWDSYRKNIILEGSSEYNHAMSLSEKDKIVKLEKIKTLDHVYGTLAKLELASYYNNNQDFNKAIHNYELVYKSKDASKIYKNFAELMIIKIKVTNYKISLDEGLKLYNSYIKKAEYFKNIAILSEASLLIEKEQKEGKDNLNEILTDNDNEAPSFLLYIAKIMKKRLS